MVQSLLNDVANTVIGNIIKVGNVILNAFWYDFRKVI